MYVACHPTGRASPAAVEAISESAGRRSASHVVRRRLLKADCRAFAGRSLGGWLGSSRARNLLVWRGRRHWLLCSGACEMITWQQLEAPAQAEIWEGKAWLRPEKLWAGRP